MRSWITAAPQDIVTIRDDNGAPFLPHPATIPSRFPRAGDTGASVSTPQRHLKFRGRRSLAAGSGHRLRRLVIEFVSTLVCVGSRPNCHRTGIRQRKGGMSTLRVQPPPPDVTSHIAW